MTEDFMKWAGLDEPRWQLLQNKLRHLIEKERTPARVMIALMNDNSIGCREQCVLSFWLGRLHIIAKKPDPVLEVAPRQVMGLN